MRGERLFRALGRVDPALVEEALSVRRRMPWKRWAAMAACLALVMGLGWRITGGFQGVGAGSSGADSGSSGGISADSSAPADPGEGVHGGGIEDGF